MPTKQSTTRLREGLEDLHRKGLVHGDVREANVLVDSNGDARLIDFDWSERMEVARYPPLLNHELEWVPGGEAGNLIAPEHDIGMFELYLLEMEKRKPKASNA
jgi:serine/threonine protein kinase